MKTSRLRLVLCWVTIATVPMSVWAADTDSAMLYTKGATWLNGGSVPKSSAIFPGDLVQTRSDSIANINAVGSNVMILADSLVKFEGQDVALEHGSVTVATSRELSAKVGEITVAPASDRWTEFQVIDTNGTVQIVAQKGDVSVSDQSGTTTVSQGQQTTRSESQHKRRNKGGGAPIAAGGSILDSQTAIWVGAGVIGGLATWAIIQSDNPASPSAP